MWLYKIFVALCVVKENFIVAATSPDNSVGDDKDDSDVYFPSLEWSDTFDWQLLKVLSAEKPGNVLVSPLSIKIALLMLYEGSTGSTEKQLQTLLQLSPDKTEVREKYKHLLDSFQDTKNGYVINIGTRLFLDSGLNINDQYAQTIRKSYDADIESTNFTNPKEACRSINSWADILTKGRIKQLTSPDDINNDVLLIVGNVVYFKGSWRHRFPKNRTQSGGFYVSPTDVVSVSYMSNTDRYYYGESKEMDAKLLRLPYKGHHFSLFFLLPNSKGGLSDLLKRINLQTLKRQLYLMDERTVDVTIPKFRFDFSSSYTKILQDFGLTTLFSPTASLPDIAAHTGTGSKWLFVNDIKQKSGIEINEEGSTIFSATEIQLGNKFGEADYSFNATHPFLFFLEDQITGAILFAGKVENPLQSDAVSLPTRFGGDDTPVFKDTESQQRGSLQLNPGAPPPDNTISSRFNYFDLELLKAFDEHQNYIISPASIKATLGMVLEGARGRCAEEIGRVLRIPIDPSNTRQKLQGLLYNLNDKSGTTVLETANAAFISDQYQVVPEFERNLKQFYKADVRLVKFIDNQGAANIVNGWVKNATQGLIPEIVNAENFNSDATLVIANALYFKGLWKNEFEEKSTYMKCFRNHRSACTNIKMMHTVDNFNYKFIDDLDAQAIELPYGDGKYAMLVLLPSEIHSVDGLIRDLQHMTFSSILNKLEPTEVLIDFPKFEIEYTADIVPALQTLGIAEVFGPNANLSGIIPKGQIKINNIVHKAKIEVNEKGTVAAGATGVIVIPLMGSSMPRFIADHPFLFFIYHVESRNIIFEGRLNQPPEVFDQIFEGPLQSVQNVEQPTAHRHGAQGYIPQGSQDTIPLPQGTNNQQSSSSTYPQKPSIQTHPLFFPTDTKASTNTYTQFANRNFETTFQQRQIIERTRF